MLANRHILLALCAFATAGCLDFSVPPSGLDASSGDAGHQPLDDAGPIRDAGEDAETQVCPARDVACDGHCGRFLVEGCEPYACDPCPPTCIPTATCASIEAECGSLNNGCGVVVDCTNLCGEGVRCVENRCCVPEAPEVTCRSQCGGTAVNRCGDSVACDDPCSVHAGGCRDASPPRAATCVCPHAFQGATCEQSQLPFLDPIDVALDPLSGRAYIVDSVLRALLVVDTDTGARFTLSDGDDDGTVRGTGPAFERPIALELDLPGRRALVLDVKLNALLAVDLEQGHRTVVSSPDVGSGPALNAPTGLMLDLPNDRAFVVDSSDALFQVELSTGDRRILSSAAEGAAVGAGPAMRVASDLAVDFAAGRAYVVTRGAVFSVDLATGDRTLVSSGRAASDGTYPARGAGPSFSFVFGCVLDLPTGRLLVVDGDLSAVLAVDLATGDRTVLSAGSYAEVEPRGAGPTLIVPIGMSVDATGEGAWVADTSLAALVWVNLASGDRMVVADGAVGTGPALDTPTAAALTPDAKVAYVVDRSGPLSRIDLATGSRELFAGDGVVVQKPLDFVIDRAGRYAYVSDQTLGLLRIDLATGQRSLLNDAPDSPTGASLRAGQLALDETRGRLLVATTSGFTLHAVDLAHGTVSVLSDATHGTGPLPSRAQDMALDASRGALLVTDENGDSLFSIDVLEGTRTRVSGSDGSVVVGDGPVLVRPRGTVLDEAAQVAYVVDYYLSSVLAIDLTNGARRVVSAGEGTRQRIGRGAPILTPQSMLAFGAGQALVVDSGLRGLLRVDLASGDRTIVARLAY